MKLQEIYVPYVKVTVPDLDDIKTRSVPCAEVSGGIFPDGRLKYTFADLGELCKRAMARSR